jgi:hypothetical protein
VFLFVFAYFLAFTPLPYLSVGTTVMTDAAVTVGNAFATVADAVNGQATAYLGSQIALAENVGASLAFVGSTLGEGANRLLFAPQEFRADLRANMRMLVRSLSPEPIHQYKWSNSHRFWNGQFRELFGNSQTAVAVSDS